MEITVATIGGALLCVGSYFTFRGQVFRAVATCLLADACWILSAAQHGDGQGATLTAIGTAFGMAAFVKMKNGQMQKELEHERSNVTRCTADRPCTWKRAD